MKLKFTLLTALIALCFSVKAQQLPNNSFEAWTSAQNPDGWATYESALGSPVNRFSFQDTSHLYGSYSVKLVTDTLTIPNVGIIQRAGICAVGTATLDLSGTFNMSGIPFTLRPDTIFFGYKYTSPGSDTARLTIALGKGGNAVLQQNFILPLSETWGGRYAVLTGAYATNDVPDELILYAQSSFSGQVIGSTLNVDGIGFGYSASSGVNNIKNEIALNVYPNPTSSVLNITAKTSMAGYKIGVYNLFGQLVTGQVLKGSANSIDLSKLACGTYVYQILDSKNNLVVQSKVSVAH